jgi:hypothetical protein
VNRSTSVRAIARTDRSARSADHPLAMILTSPFAFTGLTTSRSRAGDSTQSGEAVRLLAPVNDVERSFAEEGQLVPRPRPRTSQVGKMQRLQHAMTVGNLLRALAVCRIDLNGPPREWTDVSKGEKRRALHELDREFNGEDWAYGRLAAIFFAMLKKIVTVTGPLPTCLR